MLVSYLRLSFVPWKALAGLIITSIVIGFPGSISPDVLVIVEFTVGLYPTTELVISLLFPLDFV